jgi:hypothetical protein
MASHRPYDSKLGIVTGGSRGKSFDANPSASNN